MAGAAIPGSMRSDTDAQRDSAIAQLISQVRATVQHGAVDRAALSAIETYLGRLAARPALWSDAEFPDPPPDSQQRRYMLHEEPDHSLALYLMVWRKGRRTPIHDHQTWACIAAVQGAETNDLYRCVSRDPAGGRGKVEPVGTREIRPGQSLSLLANDVHSVVIENDPLIRHLHLYGRALETLHDRVVFHPETGRCEPMYLHAPTLRRDASGQWSIAMGDRVVNGHRWSFVDTQRGQEVLVMLPGAQGDCRSFDPLLDALARRYRVIALSYPAIGDAHALAAGVLDVMRLAGIERATVFGTSLGGYVAQWMALREPHRVSQLVLANAFDDPRPAQDPAELARVQCATDEQFKAVAVSRLKAQAPGPLRDRMLASVQSQPGSSLRQRRLAVLSAAPLPAFERKAQTVTVIDAEDDPVLPPAMRDGLAARYPGARHQRFETGGHQLHATRPEDITRLLLALPGGPA